jgi:haloacetate dehalogenase
VTAALPLAHDLHGPADGPPVVLLHGFPQTRRIWRHLAPRLAAAGHRVVVPDLRGYGDSPKPESPDGSLYAKRAMAGDVVALMASLGAERFAVVGHDRGARVAYRLALDTPERVTRVALLDIVPTIEQWESMPGLGAVAMYHWALLAQPFPYPERLLGADPAAIVERSLSGWSGAEGVFDADDLAAHVAAFGPAAIHGACADYRAGATVDVEHDAADRAAGRRIACPALVLWGARFHDPSRADETWRRWADDVRVEILDRGHFLPEEAPDEVFDHVAPFLAGRA